MTTSNAINKGIAQGIVLKEIYSPNDNVAIVTLKIKDPKINPQIQKRPVYTIQFSAFGELAYELRTCTKGQLLYLEYYLTTNKKTDENGVTNFFKTRVITSLLIGENISGQTKNVPYINFGILQGDLVGIKNAPGTSSVALMTLRINTMSGPARISYPQITIFGSMIDSIKKYYNLGDSICIIFKIETSSKEKEDGTKEHYLDYVATEIL